MTQMSFSDAEYAGKRKQTRRERFLADVAGGALGRAVSADRAVLPQGRQWPSAAPAGNPAAHPPAVKLVRPQLFGDGRGPVRDHRLASVRQAVADPGQPPGRHHDHELPPNAANERVWASNSISWPWLG